MAGGSTRAIVAALLANAGIAVAKFIAFLVTGSGSMLAESTHSVADTGNQALLLLGDKRARRGPTVERPFGSSRESYFAAFIVAIILFTAGAGFAAHEGWEKLRHPEDLTTPIVAIIVLVIGIVLESGSFWTAIRAARPYRGRMGWWTFIRRTKVASLVVVLLEDAAALIGLTLALIGVGLSAATGDPVFDALGTLTIAALLAAIAIVMAFETRSLLIGEGATETERATIERELLATEGFTQVIVVRSEHRGPDELLIVAKVRVDPAMTAATLTARIADAERRVRAAVDGARYLFIEPDTT